MAIVNADYSFIAVDVGSFGSQSDGGIFMRSPLGKGFEEKSLGVPPPDHITDMPDLGLFPYVLVGDEAFPLKNYMLRPFPGRNLTKERTIFNYRLSRARRISENAFGILGAWWRIYRRDLCLFPENAIKAIKGTIVLHNMLQKSGVADVPIDDGVECEKTQRPCLSDLPTLNSRKASTSAFKNRDKFMEYFSGCGAVSWQDSLFRSVRVD